MKQFNESEVELIEMISKDSIQISSFIIENMKEIEFNNNHYELTDHSKFIELKKTIDVIVDKLGWLEHTGDWDPSLTIKTSEDRIVTPSGYYQFDIVEDNFEMVVGSLEGDEEEYESIPKKMLKESQHGDMLLVIPVREIKSIKVNTY